MSDSTDHPRRLLRRPDQIALAGLLAVALTVMAGWWFCHGGGQGKLLEIDRAEPLSARFEVDVNAADLPELTQLPGIGPKLAQRIVDSRESDGPFIENDDLLRVRGIGRKTLDKLHPYLRP